MVIGIEQVITRTKLRLRLNNTENDAYLEKLIDEGARHLKSEDSYIIKCGVELNIECNKAELPPFFEEFLGGRLNNGGCSGCCTNYGTTITEPGSIETEYRPPCSCPVWFVSSMFVNEWNNSSSCGYYGNFFNIQGNYIVFPSSTTATSIFITYKSKNIDDDGIMILNEDWERGLSAYAAAQFSLDYYDTYPARNQQKWDDEWKAQKKSVKSMSQFKRFKLDKQAIWTIMNAMQWDGRFTGVIGVNNVALNQTANIGFGRGFW